MTNGIDPLLIEKLLSILNAIKNGEDIPDNVVYVGATKQALSDPACLRNLIDCEMDDRKVELLEKALFAGS